MGLDSFNESNTGGGRSTPYTDDELLNALQEFYNEYGEFTATEYQNHNSSPSYSAISRRFNGLNNAKIKADIPLKRSSGRIKDITDSMKQPSKDKAFLVGCVLTDGWIHTSEDGKHIGFQVKDKELAEKFAVSLSEYSNLYWDGWNSGKTEMEARGPINIGDGDDNWRVKKGSVCLAEYFRQYKTMSYESIIEEFKNFKQTLLTSIWDCEGSITDGGDIRFANSDIDLINLYIELCSDLMSIRYSKEWDWSSEKKKYRKYGDFTVSTKISDSDVRNVLIPRKYNTEFSRVVDSNVDRKNDKLESWG